MWNLCEPSFEALVTAQVASNPLIKVDEIKVVVGSRLLVVCGMSNCNLCCKVLSTLEHSSRALTQAWSPASDKMLDLLRGLKSLVKLSHVQIDSSIFRLHYVRIPANVSVPNNNTVPAVADDHRDGVPRLLAAGDGQAVRGQPHRLRPHQGHSGGSTAY